jgi:hypothetical protein
LAAAVFLPLSGRTQTTFKAVRAVGTEFQVTLSDGRVLTSAQLVGAVLSVNDPHGGRQSIRIDAVEPDPTDPDILLHTLSVQDPATGTWGNFCSPDADDIAKGFPLSGTWSDDGRHLPDKDAFALMCAGGAVGKCVLWGYKPGKLTPNGESLWDYHQACVRMVRADYGGDGIGHTRDGTPIDFYDRIGIVKPAADPGKLSFEAAWGVDGAICVRKARIAEIISIAVLESKYPRLRGRTGEACREDQVGAALFLDRS